jgi:hypothetical protein
MHVFPSRVADRLDPLDLSNLTLMVHIVTFRCMRPGHPPVIFMGIDDFEMGIWDHCIHYG